MSSKRIMIIAGEASGDMHGAKLAQALQSRQKLVHLFGVGGIAMQAEGVQLLVDANTISVVGITEVLSRLRTIYRAMTTVKKALQERKPDLLILIDFPDFNFHVAEAAKKLEIPILYYISPQIWAWRQNRVKKIKRLVDHMAVILPFEAQFYRKHKVPVTFVGHPLLDRISPASVSKPSADPGSRPVIGLIPGSREREVTTLLPVMIESAEKIQKQYPDARFLVSCAPSISEKIVSDIMQAKENRLDMEMVKGSVSRVFQQSDLLIAASGTVTLEAALYGVPMVIIYKVSPVSYWLGKRLIKVKYIGIVNLIVQNELIPELIQDDASPESIAQTVNAMLMDPVRLRQIRGKLLQVRNQLGGPGASNLVARIAYSLIR